jgi:hypothetical protein
LGVVDPDLPRQRFTSVWRSHGNATSPIWRNTTSASGTSRYFRRARSTDGGMRRLTSFGDADNVITGVLVLLLVLPGEKVNAAVPRHSR